MSCVHEIIQFEFAGRNRTTALVRPSVIREQCALPLLLVFHGMGACGEMVVDDYELVDLAEQEQVIVAAPDALAVWPERPVSFRRNPRLWRTRPLHQGEPVDEIQFVKSLINALTIHLSKAIDSARIYACGFSNGGQLVWKLAVEDAALLAAAGIVCSTHCPPPKPGTPPLPVIWVLGDSDPFCPIDGGTIEPPWGGSHISKPVRDVRSLWLAAMDIAQEPVSSVIDNGVQREIFHGDCSDRTLEQITVMNMGHHWPGSPSRLGERAAGPIRDPFSATYEILRFCKIFSRGDFATT